MTSIILVGPRCSGKTGTGKLLAEMRHVPFVDADEVFEKRYANSIKQFVQDWGWGEFRRCEAETLFRIFQNYHPQDIILAPGGGAVAHDQGKAYREQNVDLLMDFGTIVYILPSLNLEESARILVERMNKDSKSAGQRPSLTQAKTQYEEMLQTLQKRDGLYRAAADRVLYNLDLTQEQTAQHINDLVK